MTDQQFDPSESEVELEDNGTDEGKEEEGDNSLEKRYSASSREAKRLAMENKKLAEERRVDTESMRIARDVNHISTLDPEVAKKAIKRLYDEGLYTSQDYQGALEYIKNPDSGRVDTKEIVEKVKADIVRENEEKELKALLKEAGKSVREEFEDEYSDLNLPHQKAKKIIEGIIAKNRKPIEDGKALASLASHAPRNASHAVVKDKPTNTKDPTTPEYWISWGHSKIEAERRAEHAKKLSSKK